MNIQPYSKITQRWGNGVTSERRFEGGSDRGLDTNKLNSLLGGNSYELTISDEMREMLRALEDPGEEVETEPDFKAQIFATIQNMLRNGDSAGLSLAARELMRRLHKVDPTLIAGGEGAFSSRLTYDIPPRTGSWGREHNLTALNSGMNRFDFFSLQYENTKASLKERYTGERLEKYLAQLEVVHQRTVAHELKLLEGILENAPPILFTIEERIAWAAGLYVLWGVPMEETLANLSFDFDAEDSSKTIEDLIGIFTAPRNDDWRTDLWKLLLTEENITELFESED